MKQAIIFISIILICLHMTLANDADGDSPRRVGSIHQRIIAVPSSRAGSSIALENNKLPTIDRTIQTLRRFRRVRKSVTAYPKHHMLQPIELPLDEAHPKQSLNSTKAPYTDNHHSWKKN